MTSKKTAKLPKATYQVLQQEVNQLLAKHPKARFNITGDDFNFTVEALGKLGMELILDLTDLRSKYQNVGYLVQDWQDVVARY